MTLEEVQTYAKAMKLKMKRFSINSIVLTAYRNDICHASINFVGKDQHIWHAANDFNQIFSFDTEYGSATYKWIKGVELRNGTLNLHNRFRATLDEDIDFAHCFEWLLCISKESPIKLICISGLSLVGNCDIPNFFLPTDSPESIFVEWDLHGLSNIGDDENDRL